MSSLTYYLKRGSFSFLRPVEEEIRQVTGGPTPWLPEPQKIFLMDESATPLVGFPILKSDHLQQLEEALEDYLLAEEEAHLAYHQRHAFDSRNYAARWDRYRQLLAQATENVILSGQGQTFAGVFWLYHSIHLARCLKQTPKRLLRIDLKVGRELGDTIKYEVFFKLIDRAITLSYDTAHALAAETDEEEEALFPTLLARMRDNVLIFTEDLVSSDLRELSSYFHGCLKIEGRKFRDGLKALLEWHRDQLASDPAIRSAVAHLLKTHPDNADSWDLLIRPGYTRFLSDCPGYPREQLLSRGEVKVWEGLLAKLKEFEVLHALRRMVLPVSQEEEGYFCRDRSAQATWLGGPPEVHLSSATRPIDFMVPWVVDPQVERYGLVYDIKDFSSIISTLGRARAEATEQAFRMLFRFQRRVNKMASSWKLRLEKYLGDGALYSSRHGRQVLIAAIHLQRHYVQFLEQGLPFDRGLRIAINYSRYRLLPLETGEQMSRYEFFGHGIVELSRLATGKATQEIDDFKTYLISSGYPEVAVHKFFAPMLRQDSELVDQKEHQRRFYAYINKNGTLINEGMVAAEPYIARLGNFDTMYLARDHGHGYIAVPIEDESGHTVVGIRKLGFGKFKGLDPQPVYEIVDGGHWNLKKLKKIPSMELPRALERLFASSVGGRRAARSKEPV